MPTVGTARVNVEPDMSGFKEGMARQLRDMANLLDPPKRTGAFIEIVERTDHPDAEIIVPNEVRINGASLYASAEDPITVHEVSSEARDAVRVTLTLLAKRVTFAAESKDA